jgi:hypothetical protein
MDYPRLPVSTHHDAPSRGLWIVPLALCVHNLEEALTFGAMLPRLSALWTRLVGRPVALPSESDLQRVLIVVSIATIALWVAARWLRPAAYALVVIQAVMVVNVVSHVAAAALLGGYAPGVATALLVEAPASFVVFIRLSQDDWRTPFERRLLWPLAVLLHWPGLVLLLAWARRG